MWSKANDVRAFVQCFVDEMQLLPIDVKYSLFEISNSFFFFDDESAFEYQVKISEKRYLHAITWWIYSKLQHKSHLVQ